MRGAPWLPASTLRSEPGRRSPTPTGCRSNELESFLTPTRESSPLAIYNASKAWVEQSQSRRPSLDANKGPFEPEEDMRRSGCQPRRLDPLDFQAFMDRHGVSSRGSDPGYTGLGATSRTRGSSSSHGRSGRRKVRESGTVSAPGSRGEEVSESLDTGLMPTKISRSDLKRCPSDPTLRRTDPGTPSPQSTSSGRPPRAQDPRRSSRQIREDAVIATLPTAPRSVTGPNMNRPQRQSVREKSLTVPGSQDGSLDLVALACGDGEVSPGKLRRRSRGYLKGTPPLAPCVPNRFTSESSTSEVSPTGHSEVSPSGYREGIPTLGGPFGSSRGLTHWTPGSTAVPDSPMDLPGAVPSHCSSPFGNLSSAQPNTGEGSSPLAPPSASSGLSAQAAFGAVGSMGDLPVNNGWDAAEDSLRSLRTGGPLDGSTSDPAQELSSDGGTMSSPGAIKGSYCSWVRGSVLGRGSLGVVYQALNQSTGLIFAVKEVPIDQKLETDIKFQQALEHEVSFLKDLKHPHIVSYLGHDYINSSIYIYLEYMPEGSVAKVLADYGPLPEDQIKTYAAGLLDGLEYLHKQNPVVLHRDIKGANILVANYEDNLLESGHRLRGQNSIVKLADFGCSKRTTDTMSQSLRGSIPWMAPEVIQQTGYGRRSDVWSFGCVLIEMATAKPPWGKFDNAMVAMMRIGMSEDTPPVPSNVSEVCQDFIRQCTQRDKNERPLATTLLEHPFIADRLSREA